MSLHVNVINDTADFLLLRTEWESLLRSTPQDCPYLSHGRLFTWWSLFGEDKDLRILTCRTDGGQLVGLMPAYVTRIGRRFTARALRFLGDSDVGSTNLSVISLPEAQAEVISAIHRHLTEKPRCWDLLDFAYIAPDEPFLRLVQSSRAARIVPRCGSTQRINLPGDWDTYRAGLSPARRKSLNAAMNKSARLGDEIELIAEEAQLPSAMKDFWRLHETRMSTKMGPSFGTRPGYRIFTERYTHELLAEGRLRLAFLRREGERVAVTYQFVYGDVMYGEKSGFDASRKSADLLRPLLGTQIRSAIESGYSAYDMMLGDEQYKREWGVNETEDFSHVRVYDMSLNGTLRRGRDAIAEKVERLRTERQAAAVAQ